MKKFLNFSSTSLLFIAAIYFVGPQVDTPELDSQLPSVPQNLKEIHTLVTTQEAAIENIKPNNQSVLLFEDSIPKKTKYSVLYYHGFTASPKEGDPVYRDIAKGLGANLYVPRLYGHLSLIHI